MTTIANKTRQEWLDEINALVTDDRIRVLVNRLFPMARFSFRGEPSYDSLQMENKPPRRLFDNEMEVLRQELLDDINARFDEIDRIAALEARIAALQHPLAAASRVAGVPNGALVLRKLIQDDDEALLVLIEAEDAIIIQEALDEDTRAQEKRDAIAALPTHKANLEGTPTPIQVNAAVLDIIRILE